MKHKGKYLFLPLLQDQRQTEAIQLLQAQLTNMTQLVSNLSTTVAELKHEVIVIDGAVGNSVIKVDFVSENFNPRRLSFIENFFRTPECGSLKLRKYINYLNALENMAFIA